MRKKLVCLSFLVLFAASAFAAETARVPLLNGVYSVAAPADWYFEQQDDGAAAMFTPKKGSPEMVVFTAPNVTVGDDYAEYAGVQAGLIFDMLGEGEVVGEEEEEFNGFPSVVFSYAVETGKGQMMGIGRVIDYDGAAVVAHAIAPAESFEELLPVFAEIIDSHEIHPEHIEDNAELLAEVAELLNRQIAEAIGE